MTWVLILLNKFICQITLLLTNCCLYKLYICALHHVMLRSNLTKLITYLHLDTLFLKAGFPKYHLKSHSSFSKSWNFKKWGLKKKTFLLWKFVIKSHWLFSEIGNLKLGFASFKYYRLQSSQYILWWKCKISSK